MGEARNRGTFAERQRQARDSAFEEAEVLVALSKDANGGLRVQMVTRDEEPDQASPALIFAGYLNANLQQLAGEATALHRAHKANENGETDAPQDGVHIQPARPRLAAVDGTPMTDAKAGLEILGPDGRPLQ